MSEEYEDMTVAELKVLLKEAGLPVSGRKSDLIARLSDSAEEKEVVSSEAADDSDEDWDDEDDWDEDAGDDVYVVKQKPVLSQEMKDALKMRAEKKKKTPSFRRTEWFRYKRLSKSGWRYPNGMDNKLRKNLKYRGSLVRIGHGKVAAARGLHSSGFREVAVKNPNDLEEMNPELEAARVGATVGGRKRELIHARADELGIRVLNRRRNV
ncbi:MAG TPA: 50S ribosomal protein L32e [Candidatus Poseidoniales archaeon]|jgi:large subunit ribosomal protein L32e|nr:MAG: 50S ribosomal protein L32e [Euryarchaeota archaeon]HIG03089.1 50S ribosomal protein L32e [Candidatus Poseidoniales archaeon]HIK78461.1 50S ribosomal protein L32e [Candidatus Poseidoniales archaeon]